MTEPAPAPDVRVPVASDIDIVSARQQGRALAMQLGFSSSDATMVATAISELARNIVLYARRGEIILGAVVSSDHRGLAITACDNGDGIADIRQALQDGYSTSGRMGVGLPGVKRLMDEFEISSEQEKGTTITMIKWGR